MYTLLVRLMILSAIIEIGFTLSEFSNCTSQQCLAVLESKSRQLLTIEWKPISVFPEVPTNMTQSWLKTTSNIDKY